MNKINYLFIVIFLLMISLPAVFTDRNSVISEKENRTLEVIPKLINNDGKINLDYPRSFDNYVNDRFGFRDSLISFMEIIFFSSKKVTESAVIGKDGWYFATSDILLNDFFKVNLFSDAEIAEIIKAIDERAKWCENNGIKFLLLIPPNKHNVYPEYYPFARPEGITRTEQLLKALPNHLKDIVIYPLDDMFQNKNDEYPLYLETDTHWNLAGSYVAYKVLLERIKQLFPDTVFPDVIFNTEISHKFGGDIAIPKWMTAKMTVPTISPHEGWEYYYEIEYIKNKHTNTTEGIMDGITRNKNTSLPKAIFLHDSFGSYIRPYTSLLFSTAEYYWHDWDFKFTPEVNKEYILEKKPDILIWELIERLIHNLAVTN